MKAEKKDFIEACKSELYRALIHKEKIGIQVTTRFVYFPNLFDRWHNTNSDENGVYWIPKDGNEELEYELLQLKSTLIHLEMPQIKTIGEVVKVDVC